MDTVYFTETRNWKLKVRIKKLHPDAVIPKYAKPGDAGLDLTAVEKFFDQNNNICYRVGLAFEIPEGYVGYLFPRGSLTKKDLLLSNSVGVIDSGYRGDLYFKYKVANQLIENGRSTQIYEVGDRVGQIVIMPYPQIELEEVDELSETERGDTGFGSSGN
jgi:dUTP pyrophosphatase